MSQLDAKEVARLDLLLDRWRCDLRNDDDEQALYVFLNGLAQRFGVIGGAFGVIDAENNRFVLQRYYTDTEPTGRTRPAPLFPYLEPAPLDCVDELVPEAGYSDWIHGLFAVQRHEQRFFLDNVDDSAKRNELPVPEFFRKFEEGVLSPLITLSNSIVTTLRQWLAIWDAASKSASGLGTTIAQARTDTMRTKFWASQTESSELSIQDTISLAIKRTAPWFQREIDTFLPETTFFLEPSDNSVHAEDSNLARAHKKAKATTLAKIFELFDVTQRSTLFSDVIPESRDADYDEEGMTLLWRLKKLHKDALFPVIPYLFIKLYDKRNLHHFVLPVLKSKAFPVRVYRDEASEPSYVPCGMVMLGTLTTTNEPNTAECKITDVESHLRIFSLLMRMAAEPIADAVFYGGIQKKALKDQGRKEGVKETLLNFFRTLSHEIGPLQVRLLRDWLVPYSAIDFASKDPRTEHLVVTLPDAYRMVADKFMLWTSKGWLERKKLDEKSVKECVTGMPFSEVLRVLTRCAVESEVVSSKAEQPDSLGLRNPLIAEKWNSRFLELAECAMERIQLPDDDSTRRIRWEPWSRQNSSLYHPVHEPATMFCRLFIAITSNSLKNAPTGKISTTFEYNLLKGTLRMTQKNELTGPIKQSTDRKPGTRDVIRFLVEISGGDDSYTKFQADDSQHQWITEVIIPAPFLSERDDT